MVDPQTSSVDHTIGVAKRCLQIPFFKKKLPPHES